MSGTILTIDDEPAIRTIFRRGLERAGYDVLEAADGRAGVKLSHSKHPDLVLCDLRMPGMDGLDVLTQIRSEAPDLPVIMISGAGAMSDAVEALKRGASDYVTKPIVDSTLLYSAVERALERSRLLEENRKHQTRLERLNGELKEALEQLQTDQEAGRRIQFQLLPTSPLQYGEYQFSRRLFPSLYLSGDFIDYFDVGDGHVIFYMADVSGHGAASAFVTVMVKTLMGQYRDAYINDGDGTILNPAATLERIDDDLKRLNLNKHLTMLYGQLNLREDTICFCNGGHYPYPILSSPETATVIEMPGCALGLLPEPTFSNQEVAFPQGARLLLLSDGALEIMPTGTLREKNSELCRLTSLPDADIDSLAKALGVGDGVKVMDDVAILLVERGKTR